MNALQYLKQAYRLNELINSHQAEIKNLRDLSTSIGSTDVSQDRVQSSGQTDKIGTVVAKIVDLENKVKGEMCQLVDLKNEIHDKINNIQDVDERLVLRLQYIEFLSWDDTAKRMHYSLRQVHRIHDRALNGIEV